MHSIIVYDAATHCVLWTSTSTNFPTFYLIKVHIVLLSVEVGKAKANAKGGEEEKRGKSKKCSLHMSFLKEKKGGKKLS